MKDNELGWLTTNTVYEGSPLYLRLPDYKDVWDFQSIHNILVCITHNLDSVTENGLPTTDYNASLIDFDREVVNLYKQKDEGIIILVETFRGTRNYWFYVNEQIRFNLKFKELKMKHHKKSLELSNRKDSNWSFIKKYPIELYNK